MPDFNSITSEIQNQYMTENTISKNNYEKLSKDIYLLAVEKSKLDKETKQIVEDINMERKNFAENERNRLSKELTEIEIKIQNMTEQEEENLVKETDLKIQKEKLVNEYASVYSKDNIYTNAKLNELTISLNSLETRLNEIDIEGRSISNEMMRYEELQVDTKVNESSEPESSTVYQFTPFTEEEGIINYMGVEADKIYLANKKTILSQEFPSYLPPVEIRRNAQYDIPAFKVNDNEYLLKGPNFSEIYRVTLDVYAAVLNYHLEFDRAAFAALAQRNEASRKFALKAGEKSFGIVDKKSIPLVPCKLDINSLPETGVTHYINKECKPSRVALKSNKSYRMNIEPFYFIQGMSENKKAGRNFIFAMHDTCLTDVKQKILDMELQKADWETSWTKGRETSYGDSNLNTALLEGLGITVKRQNGDIIRTKEINEVASVINRVYSIYGNISDSSREFGLKVSHAGNTRMHASKAIGVFTSYQKAIGISFADGLSQATLTASHEYAHFLDHLSGREAHAWHSSDIPGTLENTIAVTFRKHMNSASGDYWNRTCECFARAMEEYTQITMLRDENPLISSEELNTSVSRSAYMDYELFEEHITPQVQNLLLQYQNRFIFEHENAISVKEEKSVLPAVSASFEEHSVETVLKQMDNASYAQLELFEPAAEFNAQENEFYTQLYDYFERKVYLQEKHLSLSKTPPIFQYIGIENYQISISTITLDDAQEINGLSKDEIEYSLRSISDPLLVYMAQTNEEKRYVLAIDTIKENKTIGLFMICNEKTNQLIVDGIQTIKDEEFQLWNEEKLLQYIDEIKISEWQTRKPVQISASTYFMNALAEDNVKTKSGYISKIIAEHPEKSFVSTDPALTREHIREANGALRKYVNPVLKGEKSGLWKAFRDFKKQGVFNIVGASVETDNEGTITKTGWKQMYQALNIYRDKRFETFRVLFVSPEGEVRDQLALSSYLPNKVNIEPINNALRDTIIEHAKTTNTNIVLVHNHPSGNIKPSIQDENITDILNLSLTTKDNTQLLQGHIILDHDTFSVWEKEKGWSAVTSSSPSHDPLMKKRNPDFTREKIINETALSNAARQINESERWNCTDWVPVMFAGNSTKISALRYYSKEWFENQSSNSIHEEFQTIGGKTGTIWAFPVVSDELSEDESLRTAIYKHMKNGCFRDFYFAGETSKTSGIDLYGRSIFEDLTINDIRERTATEATFDIPNTNDIKKATELPITLQSGVKDNSTTFNDRPIHKSGFVNNSTYKEGEKNGFQLHEEDETLWRANGVSVEFKRPGSYKWEHMIDTDDPGKTNALVEKMLEQEKYKSEKKEFMEEKEVPTYLQIDQSKASTERRDNFYRKIGIDPKAPTLPEGKSLEEIEVVYIDHYSFEKEEYTFRADKVLYDAFIDDSMHPDGTNPDSIHGLGEFLKQEHFDFSEIGAEDLFNRVSYLYNESIKFQEQNCKKSEPKNTSKIKSPNIFTEPHNPVTGEIFVGENTERAKYVMKKIQSKDPRFLESTDIVKTGLSLKRDTKEALIVSVGKKSKFFYNAVNIEGIPQKTNIKEHIQVKNVGVKKQKETEMEIGL